MVTISKFQKRAKQVSTSAAKTRVFVAGHNGMVGSAIVRQLSKQSNIEVVTLLKTRTGLD